MGKKVLISYIDSDGCLVVDEPNILVEFDDAFFAAGKEISITPFDISVPGCILFEDEYGLWQLNRSNLVEMKKIEE